MKNEKMSKSFIAQNNLQRVNPPSNASSSKSSSENPQELLLFQLVHNILNDPTNVSILLEYVAQSDDQRKHFQSPVQINLSRGRHSRDISNDEIIRPRDLPQCTGLSRTQCWRLSKDSKSGFPAKIRLSSGAVGFSKISIQNWIKSREEITL